LSDAEKIEAFDHLMGFCLKHLEQVRTTGEPYDDHEGDITIEVMSYLGEGVWSAWNEYQDRDREFPDMEDR
jgi:hypothetical protein